MRLLGRYVFREILTSAVLGTLLATFIIFLHSADKLFAVLVGYPGFATEACVVAPSVLIDDLELRALDDEQPKLPVVAAPEFTH